MVEILKYLCIILLGNRITVHMDHKNIMCNNIISEIFIRWNLLLEEYGSTVNYIKGPDNDAGDALRSLLLINSDVTEINITKKP